MLLGNTTACVYVCACQGTDTMVQTGCLALKRHQNYLLRNCLTKLSGSEYLCCCYTRDWTNGDQWSLCVDAEYLHLHYFYGWITKMCKCKKEDVYPSWGLVSWLWRRSPALLPWCRCGPIEVGGGPPGQQQLWPCRPVAAWQPPATHLHSDGHRETIVTWSTAFCWWTTVNVHGDYLRAHLCAFHDEVPGHLDFTSHLLQPGWCDPGRGVMRVRLPHRFQEKSSLLDVTSQSKKKQFDE